MVKDAHTRVNTLPCTPTNTQWGTHLIAKLPDAQAFVRDVITAMEAPATLAATCGPTGWCTRILSYHATAVDRVTRTRIAGGQQGVGRAGCGASLASHQQRTTASPPHEHGGLGDGHRLMVAVAVGGGCSNAAMAASTHAHASTTHRLRRGISGRAPTHRRRAACCGGAIARACKHGAGLVLRRHCEAGCGGQRQARRGSGDGGGSGSGQHAHKRGRVVAVFATQPSHAVPRLGAVFIVVTVVVDAAAAIGNALNRVRLCVCCRLCCRGTLVGGRGGLQLSWFGSAPGCVPCRHSIGRDQVRLRRPHNTHRHTHRHTHTQAHTHTHTKVHTH